MDQIDLSNNKQLKSVILRGHFFDEPKTILPDGVDVIVNDLRMSKEEYKQQSLDTIKEHRNIIGNPNALKQFRNLIGNPIALAKEEVDEFGKSTMAHLKQLGLIEN